MEEPIGFWLGGRLRGVVTQGGSTLHVCFLCNDRAQNYDFKCMHTSTWWWWWWFVVVVVVVVVDRWLICFACFIGRYRGWLGEIRLFEEMVKYCSKNISYQVLHLVPAPLYHILFLTTYQGLSSFS